MNTWNKAWIEFKLLLFVKLIGLAIDLLPKKGMTRTKVWLSAMPLEEMNYD